MGEQNQEHAAVEQEHAGLESTLSQSGFSAAGASGEAPPPFQLSADEGASAGFGAFAQSAPLQLQEAPAAVEQDNPGFGDGLDRVIGSTDAELAERAAGRPEDHQSEISSISTVDNEAIAHQGLTRPVGDTTVGRVQNIPGDVVNIQRLLVMQSVLNAGQVSTIQELQASEEEEFIPAETLAAIRTFQTQLQEAGSIRTVDGVVDPRGTTFRLMQADPEQQAEPTDRGDRVAFTDENESFAIEAEFEDQLEGLEGVERAYLLEMLSIYVGRNRDVRGEADEVDQTVIQQGNQAGYDQLAAHIANHTDPGGANGERSLVNSDRIMAFLHEIGYWTDFPRRASIVAEREYEIWTEADGDGQRTEGTDAEVLERLRAYTYSGNAGLGNAAQAAADEWPWSAVFISHVMHGAGAGDTFNYSPSHSQYAGAAYQNTIRPEDEQENSNEISNMFSADPAIANVGDVAEPVQVGDLIHFTRGRGADRLQGAQIAPALSRRQAFLSHSDLVTTIEIYAPTYNPAVNPTGTLEYSAETLAAVQADGADYTIFAVTVGGNTSDYTIPEGEQGENAEGDRNNINTAGRKYWPLNDDLTLIVRDAPGNVMPYGVMRLGQSVAPAPAAEGEAPAGPEGAAGPRPEGPPRGGQ